MKHSIKAINNEDKNRQQEKNIITHNDANVASDYIGRDHTLSLDVQLYARHGHHRLRVTLNILQSCEQNIMAVVITSYYQLHWTHI